MPEPASQHDIAEHERDARVEQLLLAGLDHYFAGQYERAVHVWTRVLFLDRGHARARAYLERARAAQAERHRQSDELLHRGTTAFERGQAGAARTLLTAAVEQGAASEVALSYLERLDRLDQPAPVWRGPEPAEPTVAPRPVAAAPRRVVWSTTAAVMTLVGGGALIGFGAALAGHAPWRAPADRADSAPAAAVLPLPTVRPSEVTLTRARTLFDTGHPADAMRLLEAIPIADPHRPEADRLLAEIQRALLSAAPETTP
jgi:hypothetical protein